MSNNFDPNQNHYIYIEKDTTPLMFIHGVGLDHQMWDPQINSLKEFSTITYDLLGHGKTPYKKEKLSLRHDKEIYTSIYSRYIGKENVYTLYIYIYVSID